MEKDYKHSMTYHSEWKNKHGILGFKMTNDYLFRMLLQRDELTLKAILASVMGINVNNITEVVITNPIVPGEAINEKEIHLDVSVLIKTTDAKIKKISVEMQAYTDEFWIDRSVFYLCRAYDELNKGRKYKETLAIWQISFCDFALFEEEPAFVSNFQLINTQNIEQIYTEKIKIVNINLKSIDRAENEYIKNGLVKWAKFFKAESWEDLREVAKEDEVMDYAISSIWQLTEDQKIREQMRRQEENEREWNYREELIKKYKDEIEKLRKENDILKEKILKNQ